MKIEPSDVEALRPLIEAIVEETVDRIEVERAKFDRLAYIESEAAALVGMQPHALRDARLRGEISGAKCGKRINYTRDELLAFLSRNRTNGPP